MKKLLIAGALAVSSFGATATEISVGGIVWDEVDIGFGAQANFQQWFVDAGTATTTNDNGTIIDTSDDYLVLNDDTAVTGGLGKELVGIGEYTSFPDGRGPLATPDSFCVTLGCELTFAFGGLVVNGFNGSTPTYDISNAWFNVYIDQTPDLDTTFDSDTTLGSNAHSFYNEAQNGELWAAFSFASFKLTGTIIGGLGEGTLDVRLNAGLGKADVQQELNNNTALADIAFTSDSVFQGDYSEVSNGNFKNVVPEPASIAMLGLGLLGLAASRRRKV